MHRRWGYAGAIVKVESVYFGLRPHKCIGRGVVSQRRLPKRQDFNKKQCVPCMTCRHTSWRVGPCPR